MKYFLNIIIPVCYLLAELPCSGQTPDEIVSKSESAMRGNTMSGVMSIKTVRPTWSREMRIHIWLKGNDYAMILVKSPDKDKGITYLKRRKQKTSSP